MNDTVYDIVVVGAGPAGIGASISASRLGAKVLLIEKAPSIGGVLYSCPHMPIGAAFPAGMSVGGLIDELIEHLEDSYTTKAVEIRECVLEDFGPEILYDKSVLFRTLYEMLANAGVSLMLNTSAINVLMEDNRIINVECAQGDKRINVSGTYFIDCSGDGVIATKANVPYVLGDADGAMMGASLVFKMDHVNWSRDTESDIDPYFTQYTIDAINHNKLHQSLKKLYIMRGLEADSAFFNSVIIPNVDGRDVDSINLATKIARVRSNQVIDFVQSTIPGFENARVIDIANTVGVRETVHLEAMYRLTGNDLKIGTKFQDGVVACDNPIDEVFRSSEEFSHDRIIEFGDYYTIPLRAMIPKKIKNLLFAGRHIDAEPMAFASIRGMSQCLIMGQACGVASKIALSHMIDVQKINFQMVVKVLNDSGVNGLTE